MSRPELTFERLFNLRDLGGLTTVDGRRVRRGWLFRMDDPTAATPADVEALRALGVRGVIDLRNADEVTERGSATWDELKVRQVRCSVMNYAPPVDDYPRFIEPEFCATEYQRYIAEPDVARALWRALAELTTEPTAIHCASGRDRTGVVSAMVLAAIGVEREQILHDYSVSEPGLARLLSYLEEHVPARVPTTEGHRRSFLATPPECMAAFLDAVDARWGGVAGYLAEHGLQVEAETLRANLLAD
jgi:protein-tyrosine phosphatase